MLNDKGHALSQTPAKPRFWQKPLLQLSFGQRRFQPHLIPTLGFLFLLPILMNLGLWQLDRAEEKRTIISELEVSSNAPETSLTQALQQDKSDMATIETSGQPIPEVQLVVDNQKQDGRLGYEIYSLWQTPESDLPVIVSRGWLPRKDFYQKVPEIPPFEADSIQGSLYFSKGANSVVADNAQWQQHDGAWLIGQFDFQTLAEKVKQMGYDSAPFIIRLKPDDNSEFIRQWQLIASPPEKHIAYAVQWFGMALVLVFLFIFLNLKRVEHDESTTS